jgi:predicted PurR-regulated permease PerM
MPLKEKLYIIVLIFFSFFAYLISIFLYDIMLPLLITSIVVLISYLMGMRIKKMDLKIKIGFFLIYIVIFFLILPIILIHFNPFLWKMNKQISENIGQNSQVKQFILVLNQSNYELIPMNNSFVNITLDDICKHLSTK